MAIGLATIKDIFSGAAAPGTTAAVVKDDFATMARYLLIALGTLIVALDLAEQTQVDEIVGALVTVITVGYGFYTNWKKHKEVVPAAVQTGQAMPDVQTEKEITAKLNSGQIVVPKKPSVFL